MLFLLLLPLLAYSCFEDNDDNIPAEPYQNKVALLKVDYLTHTFEGGQELAFNSSSGFTISSEYVVPSDFGSVKLVYEELEETLFEGTIVWLGLGERTYPETLLGTEDFTNIAEPVAMPSETMFQNVMYYESAFYPEDLDYTSLWHSIANLKIVESYRNSNPNAKVNVFLYTPSVGLGNPADWDYYVILKN